MANKRGKSKSKGIPKRRRPIGAAVPHVNSRRTFQQACEALEDNDPEEALKLLQQIEAQGYMSKEVLELYLDVAHELRDFDQYARISTMMAERTPDDASVILMAARGSLATRQPVSAILYFERFFKLAPSHPEAAVAEQELAQLRQLLPKFLDSFNDGLPQDPMRLASFEKILHVFQMGRFDEVIKRAEQHLQLYPTDLSARNNLAEAFGHQGDLRRSLKIVGETIAMAPDNFYALAARCRLSFFLGNPEQSRADAEQLLSMQPKRISDLTKAAQSFAYIGFDEGIRWAYEEARNRNWLKDWPPDVALLTNYYATCLAFAGDIKSARLLWKESAKLASDATTAELNLEDSQQPAGEQWGPAYFLLRDWLSSEQQEDLRQAANSISASSDASSESGDRAARRVLEKHPPIEHMLPAMLTRGDSKSQQIAQLLACGSRLPAVKSALLDYVRGSRGSDVSRNRLLMSLKERGYEIESPLTFYTNGKVQQIEMISFQITDEPTIPAGRSDETCDLMEEAFEALQQGEGAKAERLIRQVRLIEPDEPDVLNNLAAALQMQNKLDESNQLVKELNEKHPEYFFGKIAVANENINRKRYDEALEILVPLQRRKLLHSTEFFTLARSMIYVYAGKQEFEAARRWLMMLEDYEPDYPSIAQLRNFITSRQDSGDLGKLIDRIKSF